MLHHWSSPDLQHVSSFDIHCWCTPGGIIDVFASRVITRSPVRNQFREMANEGSRMTAEELTAQKAKPNNCPHERRVMEEEPEPAERTSQAWAELLKPSSQVFLIGLIEHSDATFMDRWEKQSWLWMKSLSHTPLTSLIVFNLLEEVSWTGQHHRLWLISEKWWAVGYTGTRGHFRGLISSDVCSEGWTHDHPVPLKWHFYLNNCSGIMVKYKR